MSESDRFLSPDWSAKVEPVPYAKLDNPQSLNLYAYAGNNPESVFDPDGHQQQNKAQGTNTVEAVQCTWFFCQWKKVLVSSLLPKVQHVVIIVHTADVIYNETGVLRPSNDNGGSATNLHAARVDIGRVLENRSAAGERGGTASDVVGARGARTRQYGDALSAAGEAVGSADTTGGACNYVLSYGQRMPKWVGRMKVSASFGPFVNAAGGGDVPKGAKVKILILVVPKKRKD